MPKVVKSSGREMILKVKEFCEAEQRNQGILIPLNNIRKRVAAMTGMFEGCRAMIFCRFVVVFGICIFFNGSIFEKQNSKVIRRIF